MSVAVQLLKEHDIVSELVIPPLHSPERPDWVVQHFAQAGAREQAAEALAETERVMREHLARRP